MSIDSIITTKGLSLIDALDETDKKVKQLTQKCVFELAKRSYEGVIGQIDSKNLIKTGNLRKSIGFNTKAGGAYNIFNFNYTPSTEHRFHSKRVFDAPLQAPQPPTNPYEANIFCLARYGVFLEYGTVKMSARPFFYAPIHKVFGNAEIICKSILTQYGL